MFRKAQGLPINFIVLAALAILILILGASFVVMGGSSFAKAMSPQQFNQGCASTCSQVQRAMSVQAFDSRNPQQILDRTSAWCVTQTTQDGSKSCFKDSSPCYVVFSDGVQQQLTCS